MLLSLQHPLGRRSLITYSSLLKQLGGIVPPCESYMTFAMKDFNTENETLKVMAIYMYYHSRRRNIFALHIAYALFFPYMCRATVMWALTVDQCKTKVAIFSGYTAVAVSLVSHLLLVDYHQY